MVLKFVGRSFDKGVQQLIDKPISLLISI